MISVVIAARNEEKYLPEQLAAIVPQLRPEDELILVDDGSSDGTPASMRACRHYGTKIVNELFDGRKGAAAAYNAGVNAASRPWLLLCSGNDVMQPGSFDAFRYAAARYVLHAPTLVCGDVGENSSGTLGHASFRQITLGEPLIPGPGVFIRRDCWYRYGGYRPRLHAFADWYLNHTIALRYGFVYIRQPLAWVRQHGDRYCEQVKQPSVAPMVAAELVRLWSAPENADILPFWLSSGLVDVAAAYLDFDLRGAL